MILAKDFRRAVATCEISHPAFLAEFNYFQRRLLQASEGATPVVEWLIGPSGAGKSALIRALQRQWPETKVDGLRQAPVVAASLPPYVSPTLLPGSVLEAFGMPPSTSMRNDTTGQLSRRMRDLFTKSQTHSLLLDEVNHMVESSTRVKVRDGGDWFKVVSGQLSLFMFGMPHLAELFKSNEQLRRRGMRRREFRPYDWNEPNDRDAFARCVRTYSDLFASSPWPIGLSLTALVHHCYLLSGGLVGVLSKFMIELASRADDGVAHAYDLDDCKGAAATIDCAGEAEFPAFVSDVVTDFELLGSFAHVIETNGLSMKRSSPSPASPA